MRCCASPTTSTAAEARSEAQRAARSVVDALVFREVLAPLARALGPVGEPVLAAVVDTLVAPAARRPR